MKSLKVKVQINPQIREDTLKFMKKNYSWKIQQKVWRQVQCEMQTMK